MGAKRWETRLPGGRTEKRDEISVEEMPLFMYRLVVRQGQLLSITIKWRIGKAFSAASPVSMLHSSQYELFFCLMKKRTVKMSTH